MCPEIIRCLTILHLDKSGKLEFVSFIGVTVDKFRPDVAFRCLRFFFPVSGLYGPIVYFGLYEIFRTYPSELLPSFPDIPQRFLDEVGCQSFRVFKSAVIVLEGIVTDDAQSPYLSDFSSGNPSRDEKVMMDPLPSIFRCIYVLQFLPLFPVSPFKPAHEVGNVSFRFFICGFRLVGQSDIQVIPVEVAEYGPVEFLLCSFHIPFLCLFCRRLIVGKPFFSSSQTVGMVFLSLYDSFCLEYFFSICHRYHL